MTMNVSITDNEFTQIREMIYSCFGINLTEQKRSLVEGRLAKVLRTRGYSSFEEYFSNLANDDSGAGLLELIDRISTNHTFFYREAEHFDYLQNRALPAIIERQAATGDRTIRIWSAGCSSGEESYLLAMLLREALGREFSKWEVAVLATDISISALEKAEKGIYNNLNVSKLPDFLLKKYFMKLKDDEYNVVPAIKQMVVHRKLNLVRPEYPFRKKFQVIFCRNVMIYFDQVTRKNLVDKFTMHLDSKGYLFVGHSETLGRDNKNLTYVKPALYQHEIQR
ncbi:protein-glutamate O-methyltransferase CheR [bacterium]|nr:protein-glutamate O-methyltransferase CheR [bacterium]